VFLSEQCAVSEIQQVFEVMSLCLNTSTLVYCPVDNALFEVSGVSSRYCCYGNHSAGSKL